MSTHREKLEYLLAGGKLLCDAGLKFIDKNGHLKWEGGNDSKIIDLDEMEIYHEPKWYDSLPDGPILCWVCDNQSLLIKYIRLIGSKYYDCFVDTNNNRWVHAKPLTKEEVKKYIWSAKK